MPLTVFAQHEGTIDITATVGWSVQNVLQSNICCGAASAFSYQETDRTHYLAGLSLGVLPIDCQRVGRPSTQMQVLIGVGFSIN